MSIRIKTELCIGCGRCREACPGTLIHSDESGRAYIKYPRDCWGCCSCLKECPAGAIRMFLGADIGGNGGTLHTQKHGKILRWVVTRSDGTETAVDVDPTQSNQY